MSARINKYPGEHSYASFKMLSFKVWPDLPRWHWFLPLCQQCFLHILLFFVPHNYLFTNPFSLNRLSFPWEQELTFIHLWILGISSSPVRLIGAHQKVCWMNKLMHALLLMIMVTVFFRPASAKKQLYSRLFPIFKQIWFFSDSDLAPLKVFSYLPVVLKMG